MSRAPSGITRSLRRRANTIEHARGHRGESTVAVRRPAQAALTAAPPQAREARQGGCSRACSGWSAGGAGASARARGRGCTADGGPPSRRRGWASGWTARGGSDPAGLRRGRARGGGRWRGAVEAPAFLDRVGATDGARPRVPDGAAASWKLLPPKSDGRAPCSGAPRASVTTSRPPMTGGASRKMRSSVRRRAVVAECGERVTFML